MGRASGRKWTTPPDVPWTPWQRGVMPPEYQKLRGAAVEEVWLNNVYQVIKAEVAFPDLSLPKLWHLSIKRLDKRVMRDWRHLQRIKTELVDPEAEGCELFPAESRLVDGANQYHLWVFEPPFKFPFGFDEGRKVSSESPTGGRQRAL